MKRPLDRGKRPRRILGHHENCLDSGFSLLELLVVMLIMSVAMGLFLGYNHAQRDTARLRSAANEAAQFLRMAQGFALLEGRDNECVYVPAGHRLREKLRGRELVLPDVVRLIAQEQGPDGEEQVSVALFYADGSARADALTLAAGERKMALWVDPVLGEVQVDRGADAPVDLAAVAAVDG